MKTEQEKVINKFEDLSLKYHKMSLLFHTLAESINLELKQKRINPNSKKEIREYLGSLNLDYEKIRLLSKSDIGFNTIKKEDRKGK